MEPLAYSRKLPAQVEPIKASGTLPEATDGSGLAALLIVLAPFALASWLLIGLALYMVIS